MVGPQAKQEPFKSFAIKNLQTLQKEGKIPGRRNTLGVSFRNFKTFARSTRTADIATYSKNTKVSRSTTEPPEERKRVSFFKKCIRFLPLEIRSARNLCEKDNETPDILVHLGKMKYIS